MRAFAVFLLVFLLPSAHANEEALQRLRQLQANPALHQQAYSAGQERIRFCANCHGQDGNSKRPHIPNLAAQNPQYLFNAFENFASGRRQDFVMSKLAPLLSPADRVNIALYYSEQKLRPQAAMPASAARQLAEQRFVTVCVACHGQQAEGREDVPRLAGQPAEYLRRALTRFRNQDPGRAGSVMLAVASGLRDDEIAALADYLQALPE